MLIDELIIKYGFNSTNGTTKPNYIKIPVNYLDPTIENSRIFNELYMEILRNEDMFRLERTLSGGIKLKRFMLPAYDCQVIKTKMGHFKGVELVIITADNMLRVQFAPRPATSLCGSRAFAIFKKVFKKYKIDLDKYRISSEEGKQVKNTIPAPLIKLALPLFADKVYENVHHIDYHSAYPSGLITTYPEFTEAITYMYENRHDKPVFKEVLNLSIGYMQSQFHHYIHAHLSKAAIQVNYDRVSAMAKKIEASEERMVILFNTDGIWYTGPQYHDEDEGEGLNKWSHDHSNCKFRAKGDGAYEFIENGKYTPVVRGRTLYDRIKSRDNWEWGDIYREDCIPFTFEFVEGIGLKCNCKGGN